MRVAAPHRKVKLEVKSGDNVLLSRPLPVAKPSEMIAVEIPAAKFAQIGDEVTVGWCCKEGIKWLLKLVL